MVWRWQMWRSFDNIRETFEEKGWGYGFGGHGDGGARPPLLAESGDYCVAFFKRDPGTGECWFELRDKARRTMVFVHGTHNIPTPERAAELLANHGGPLYEITDPDSCPMYGLPVAPVVSTTMDAQEDWRSPPTLPPGCKGLTTSKERDAGRQHP